MHFHLTPVRHPQPRGSTRRLGRSKVARGLGRRVACIEEGFRHFGPHAKTEETAAIVAVRGTYQRPLVLIARGP